MGGGEGWLFMNPCFSQLTSGSVALTLGAVPDGTGQIWLDDVNCRGTETTLASCPHSPFGRHNCVHAEDAGVRCVCKAPKTVVSFFSAPKNILPVSNIVKFVSNSLHPGGHQTSRRHQHSGTCGGLQQQSMGNSV